MVEVHLIYDLLPEADKDAYVAWTKRALDFVLKSPGLVEFRANRNLLGSPLIRATSVWGSLSDWTTFQQTDDWKRIESELRAFIVELRIEIWGSSPIVPEPLIPGT